MTYVSPIEEDTDDPELHVIERTEEFKEERFDFSMFFIGGIILLLVGFLRMLVFREISLLNLGFVALGFFVSLSSQTWLKRKRMTGKEIDLIEKRKETQYELQAADFGFNEQIHTSAERQRYEEMLAAQKADPDVNHKEKPDEPLSR